MTPLSLSLFLSLSLYIYIYIYIYDYIYIYIYIYTHRVYRLAKGTTMGTFEETLADIRRMHPQSAGLLCWVVPPPIYKVYLL